MTALPSSSFELTHCQECGYSIKECRSQLCPECGTDWSARLEAAQALRALAESSFVMQLKKAAVFWTGIVLLYAVGSEIAGNEYTGVFAFYTVLSIGILVGASLLIGLALCDLGPPKDRVVNVSMWIRFMPILHAPWLLIGPITVFGSMVSFVLGRIGLSHSMTMSIYMAVASVVILIWIGASLVFAVGWDRFYKRERGQLCMFSTKRVYRMHSILGALTWMGAFIFGAIGGVLGLIIVGYLLGDPQVELF